MKYLASDTYLTMHRTVPQPQLDGRAPIIPQAAAARRRQRRQRHGLHPRPTPPTTTAGTASSAGAPAGALRDLLPHFRRQEDNDHLDGEYPRRGRAAESLPSRPPLRREPRLRAVRCRPGACPTIPDFNGARQLGVGFMQHTIDRHPPALQRGGCLPVAGGRQSRASRSDGRIGHAHPLRGPARRRRRVCQPKAATSTAHADAEVHRLVRNLCLAEAPDALRDRAGRAELKAHGIEVRDRPAGVGQNLQDHHEVPVIADGERGPMAISARIAASPC